MSRKPKKNKEPRAAQGVSEAKEPRVPLASMAKANPLWGFRLLDLGGPWCWSSLDGATLKDVLSHLRDFESMTWSQIEGRRHHLVSVSRLCSDARRRLLAISRDDVDSLFSLAVSGRGRVWGVRYDHVLYLLWWDPHHAVCPSKLKHT